MCRSKFIIWLAMLGQLIALLAPTGVLAQVRGSADDNFPVIEHNENNRSTVDPYTFTATATDNSRIISVKLLYRFNGETEFSELAMSASPNGSTYRATLPNADQREGILRYYLAATDDEGNLATKGFAFDPLSRVLTAEPVVATSAKEPVEQSKSKINPLYVLLGVLALGAAASAAGGGSDSGSGGEGASTCGSEGCSINLMLTPPTN